MNDRAWLRRWFRSPEAIPIRRPEDGALYLRFIDFDRKELEALGYPLHPLGRYVSLEDLQRVADEEESPLHRVIRDVRSALSIQQVRALDAVRAEPRDR